MTDTWLQTLSQVESLIPLLGKLGREQSLKVQLAGQTLMSDSVTGLMELFDRYPGVDLERVKQVLTDAQEKGLGNGVLELEEALADAQISEGLLTATGDETPVVLYGFGRIGRLLARRICALGHTTPGMKLAAIVVRRASDKDLEKRASLLKYDSVHGTYDGVVKADVENEQLIVNGNPIKVIYASDPAEVDYVAEGIEGALLVDNTGRWRDHDGLSVHLSRPGIERVVLTAPGKQMKNIVFGVNDSDIEAEDQILSAASCTTNAITPILSVLEEKYGIESGHVETVHAYTNDQNLIDNVHKGDRRGRAAAMNMVMTETGAAKAVSKAIPSLEGKLSGSAIRVPVINVSIAVLSLNLKAGTSVEEINALLKASSESAALTGQIGYSDAADAVSSDFIGSEQAGVLDSLSTKVRGNQATLYVWYDNEYGYSCQVVRLMEKLTQSVSIGGQVVEERAA
ncbi:glyceraldehyde-3-phosphate dehydrogenase [Marinomonas mediterranea]|jgi:glyceraldehyde-3-phosphate dehydrogenase, type I|uniref:Glyceraldehyde-3-phosphate dehydrogenase n=1 Tax=Marinomonas mediterranea (strain ATCC 700492 / JCM 21426 / NBRC 103028 / MMB-1) TaxID=717774 RepID=F2K0F2_MARM1|nr:glyceraldehyde-3-phosphate dehydrogenase [Marinomonas mediterranea]ADZ89867.1 glyceraldehyde-3-phosphate dehydrogenase, type I [Marinomonas mediterranea MMB-1]WCN16085.1 glyceraldehyde-3-phosphate dehydrogenase [Marinomonas mediterranea MMB-1]